MLTDLVDLGRYPIDRPGSRAYGQMIADVRRDLDQDGCAVLQGFVHEAGLEVLVREADAVAPRAHRSFNQQTPISPRTTPVRGGSSDPPLL